MATVGQLRMLYYCFLSFDEDDFDSVYAVEFVSFLFVYSLLCSEIRDQNPQILRNWWYFFYYRI